MPGQDKIIKSTLKNKSYNKSSVVFFEVKVVVPGSGDHAIPVAEVPADTSENTTNLETIRKDPNAHLEFKGH